MRIAAANQNFETDPGGLARRIITFVAEAGWPPRDVTRIDPPNERTIYSARSEDILRLDQIDILIACRANSGFINSPTDREAGDGIGPAFANSNEVEKPHDASPNVRSGQPGDQSGRRADQGLRV